MYEETLKNARLNAQSILENLKLVSDQIDANYADLQIANEMDEILYQFQTKGTLFHMTVQNAGPAHEMMGQGIQIGIHKAAVAHIDQSGSLASAGTNFPGQRSRIADGQTQMRGIQRIENDLSLHSLRQRFSGIIHDIHTVLFIPQMDTPAFSAGKTGNNAAVLQTEAAAHLAVKALDQAVNHPFRRRITGYDHLPDKQRGIVMPLQLHQTQQD